MTIGEFLEENVYNLTPEEYNQALADLDSLDANAWIQKHSALMQEKTTGWNKVDEVKRSKPLANRIADAFADSDFNPGKNFKQDVYEADFSDVPREKFEEALSKMKQYYDEEVSSREKEFLKEKRKQEVKDWGLLRNLSASDYEKQRYIEDPQSALFGDQAPAIGDAPKTRWGSAADLGLGVAGAAGDALPGWWGLVGTGIRSARDVGHKLTDSPYQKDWEDIGVNALADAGITATTAWLPNFRKQKRMLGQGGMMPSDVGAIVSIEQEANAIKQGAGPVLAAMSDKLPLAESARRDMFRKSVKNMPESQLKAELSQISNQTDIPWSKVRAIVENNLAAANAGSTASNREFWRQMINAKGEKPIYQRANSLEEAERTVVSPTTGDVIPVKPMTTLDPLTMRIMQSSELSPVKNKMKPLFVQADRFLGGNAGGAALQLGKTATGARSPKKAQKVRTADEQAAIDDIKMSEARFWEAGFKPNKVEGDPLWEAYQEWDEENKRKNAVKHQLLGGK
jgi:hypothetical protein